MINGIAQVLIVKGEIEDIALECELEGDEYEVTNDKEIRIFTAIDEWCEELRTRENIEYEMG